MFNYLSSLGLVRYIEGVSDQLIKILRISIALCVHWGAAFL